MISNFPHLIVPVNHTKLPIAILAIRVVVDTRINSNSIQLLIVIVVGDIIINGSSIVPTGVSLFKKIVCLCTLLFVDDQHLAFANNKYNASFMVRKLLD